MSNSEAPIVIEDSPMNEVEGEEKLSAQSKLEKEQEEADAEVRARRQKRCFGFYYQRRLTAVSWLGTSPSAHVYSLRLACF